MRRQNQRHWPRIAVVGAGLAGLSAAYHLRKRAYVTIFEREDHAGGRIMTSRHPPGEHGAEFLLGSEKAIRRLLKRLELKPTKSIRQWPGYLLNGRFAEGSPDKAVGELLAPSSAERVVELFGLVRDERWPKTHWSAERWLSRFFHRDKQAIRFVSMLLSGETCAPLSHLCAGYALQCLGDDEWYRIRGGSSRLANVLSQQSKATTKLKSQVKGINPVRGGVGIKWMEGEKQKTDVFDAVVIATPQGERFLGRRPQGHFHAYISVLLDYRVCPQVRECPKFSLAHGLYTDGPLNYLHLTKYGVSSHVLRILLPNAESKLRWKNRQIVAFCLKQLRKMLPNSGRIRTSSVKRWKFGLPCGGSKESFRKVSNRIYLAGDRFGEWPSMDVAISSGLSAAKAVAELIRIEFLE